MKEKHLMKRIGYVLFALFSSVIMAVSGWATSAAYTPVYAETTVKDYDSTAIEDDLSDIDVLLYPQNDYGTPELIRFQEFCYSEKTFYNEAYGLYFYVYNPTEKPVNKNGNEANIAVAYDENGQPIAYENVALTYLDDAYNGRFIKFKITDDTPFLSRMREYAQKHNGERRYDIAGGQLYYTDGTSAYDSDVSKTYIWTGYSQGLGNDDANELSLSCNPLVTLSLQVHPTYYRPNGSNGTTVTTQDTLHSVYFSVPNSMIEEHGEMSAVKAEYLNAVLKPMLCTGNKDAYNAIKEYLGVDFSTYNSDLNYTYLTSIQKSNLGGVGAHSATGFNAFESMNLGLKVLDGTDWWYDVNNSLTTLNQIPSIYLLFGTDTFAEDSADSYTVSSTAIKDAMKASAEKFGNPIDGAEGSYSKEIFFNIDDEYTSLYIEGSDEFSLTSEVISQDFWDKLFGDYTVESSTVYDGIKAIYAVQDSDISGNKVIDCDNLFISQGDYSDFCDFYEQSTNKDETVYLFRYRISEYKSSEATLFSYEDDVFGYPAAWFEQDTNAYIFEQSVDLDFDVISVSFTNEDGTTVIGVVSNPLDIVYEGTSPLLTVSNKSYLSTILWLIGLILLLIFCEPLLKIVGFILKLPFKLIGVITKGVKPSKKKKKKK